MLARSVLRWLAAFGLWLGIAGSAEHQEAVAAGLGGLVAALAGWAALRGGRAAPVPDAAWMARIRMPLRSLLPDAVRVAAALVSRRAGAVRDARVAGLDDPRRGAGRQAFATVAASIAPNTVVLGARPKDGVLVVHELVRRPGESPL